MKWRELIKFSGLSKRDIRIILSGECVSMAIDDKEHEISLIVNLSSKNCSKLAESEFKVTSLGFFKEGKEKKASICRLIINVEEEK